MNSKARPKLLYDPVLFISAFILLGLGLTMVASSSIAVAQNVKGLPLYYAMRHGIAFAIGIVLLFVTSYVPIRFWRTLALPLLFGSTFLLVLILLPGLRHEINGSARWLFLGPISFQPSELVKLALIIYMSSFLVRHHKEVQTKLSGFLKPTAVLAMVSGLLLLEPDFGTAVVLILTVMGMLFLGGVPFTRFIVLIVLTLSALVLLSITSPYRLARLTTFLNPWADQFNTGYQLTQSLIAFGSGGIFGTGLGNSIQKLFYLPEPYTDFIYAILAEELGLLGALMVLLWFATFIWRSLQIGRRALQGQQPFSGFLAYGIALLFGIQASINIGVNIGLLPTKGLTLPLMSYGGTSLVVGLIAIGILLRIDFETRNSLDPLPMGGRA